MFRPITLHLPRVSREELARRFVVVVSILAVVALLVYLPYPLDIAAVLAPAAGIVLLAHPFLLPLALVASVPVQDLAPFPAGVPLTATRAALAAALAITPVVILTRAIPIRWSRLMIVFIVYFAIMVASLLNATSPSAGYPELYRWSVALLAFWFVIQFVQTRAHVMLAAALLAVLAFGQGALGVVQALFGYGPESFEIGMGFTRAYGTLGMPNSYAAYMEMATIPLVPLAVWASGHFWDRLNEYRRIRVHGFVASARQRRGVAIAGVLAVVLCVGLVAGMAGIVMSFSRGGWLGTLAALIAVVALLGRRTIAVTGLATALAGILILLGASATVIEVVEDRVAQLVEQVQIGDVRGVEVTEENFAAVERLAHWQTAIAMWDDHPWIGIGVGNFDSRFEEYSVHPDFLESQGHAHNYYLHILAETGVVGLTAYLVLLIGALLLAWTAYRSSDRLARAVGIASIGMTVALAVHNLFENLHVLNISVQIAVIWALAGVAVRWSPLAEPVATDSSYAEEPVGSYVDRNAT